MTSKTAAIRYARALFDVALKEQADLDHIDQELAGFVSLLDQHAPLKKVLLNPAVPVPRKRDAVVELTRRAGTSPIVSKLLALLAGRDRLALVPDLLTSFRDRVGDHRQVVRAEVTTATPLDAGRADVIARRLASVTGRKVIMQAKVDPGIIGGIVARVGSTVYDGSITRQLEKMRQRLEQNV